MPESALQLMIHYTESDRSDFKCKRIAGGGGGGRNISLESWLQDPRREQEGEKFQAHAARLLPSVPEEGTYTDIDSVKGLPVPGKQDTRTRSPSSSLETQTSNVVRSLTKTEYFFAENCTNDPRPPRLCRPSLLAATPPLSPFPN